MAKRGNEDWGQKDREQYNGDLEDRIQHDKGQDFRDQEDKEQEDR